MTEMTPLGTIARLKSYMKGWSEDAQYDVRARVRYSSVGVDVRIVDDAGTELPWDRTSMGELQVRGPWVVGAYYNNPDSVSRFTEDGWFRTGDVATIDAEGYVQITDRTKDLIKSGGEWISSVDLENMIMSHPKVLEAAVIAVPHPKWVERPLACVVPKPGTRPYSVWVPDRYLSTPHTGGTVLVPGHWERRVSDHESYVPPLTTINPADGRLQTFPAGVRPRAEERTAP